MIQRSFDLIKKKKKRGIKKLRVLKGLKIKSRFLGKVGKKKVKRLNYFFLENLEKNNFFFFRLLEKNLYNFVFFNRNWMKRKKKFLSEPWKIYYRNLLEKKENFLLKEKKKIINKKFIESIKHFFIRGREISWYMKRIPFKKKKIKNVLSQWEKIKKRRDRFWKKRILGGTRMRFKKMTLKLKIWKKKKKFFIKRNKKVKYHYFFRNKYYKKFFRFFFDVRYGVFRHSDFMCHLKEVLLF